MRAHRDCATHHQGRYCLSYLGVLFELIYLIFAATQCELYIEVPAKATSLSLQNLVCMKMWNMRIQFCESLHQIERRGLQYCF